MWSSLWPEASLLKTTKNVNRETQARAVSPNSRAQLCLQAKDLDAFVFRKNLTCDNYSLANTWAKHLKLSAVLCLPKVNLWCSLETVWTEAWWPSHTSKGIWGETLSLHLGSDNPQTHQEDRPMPLSALKNKDQDKRQRRDLSPAKPINNSHKVKTDSGKQNSI